MDNNAVGDVFAASGLFDDCLLCFFCACIYIKINHCLLFLVVGCLFVFFFFLYSFCSFIFSLFVFVQVFLANASCRYTQFFTFCFRFFVVLWLVFILLLAVLLIPFLYIFS